MDLTQMLQSNLSEDMIDQLSQQLGGADKEKTAIAASGIMSTLMGAMARNASTPDGSQALNQALDNDHDGSILDDVMGMVTGQNTGNVSTRTLNGSGILGHILGTQQRPATDVISKMSGLNGNQVGSLMTMLAPVVMGMLGRKKREDNLDAGGITDLLGGFMQSQKQANNPAMGMLERFLDADGDGDITDDVANLGMKMLGGFFKR